MVGRSLVAEWTTAPPAAKLMKANQVQATLTNDKGEEILTGGMKYEVSVEYDEVVHPLLMECKTVPPWDALMAGRIEDDEDTDAKGKNGKQDVTEWTPKFDYRVCLTRGDFEGKTTVTTTGSTTDNIPATRTRFQPGKEATATTGKTTHICTRDPELAKLLGITPPPESVTPDFIQISEADRTTRVTQNAITEHIGAYPEEDRDGLAARFVEVEQTQLLVLYNWLALNKVREESETTEATRPLMSDLHSKHPGSGKLDPPMRYFEEADRRFTALLSTQQAKVGTKRQGRNDEEAPTNMQQENTNAGTSKLAQAGTWVAGQLQKNNGNNQTPQGTY